MPKFGASWLTRASALFAANTRSCRLPEDSPPHVFPMLCHTLLDRWYVSLSSALLTRAACPLIGA
jgi:hypothetical protein